MFGVVAHSLVKWSGKKWISSTMVLVCFRILVRNLSHSFAMSALHSVQYKYYIRTKPMNCASIPVWPNWAANHICARVCFFSYSVFFLPFESIVNDGLQSGHTRTHTHTNKSNFIYINRLIPFIGIYYLSLVNLPRTRCLFYYNRYKYTQLYSLVVLWFVWPFLSAVICVYGGTCYGHYILQLKDSLFWSEIIISLRFVHLLNRARARG